MPPKFNLCILLLRHPCKCSQFSRYAFNPFLVNIPMLYPLKIPENLCFFGGHKIGTFVRNWLNSIFIFLVLRDHSFNMYAKFSEKLTFLTP